MTEQEQCFIKLWETWKKIQAIGDIISYFSPIIIIVVLKILMIFFPSVSLFFPRQAMQ